MSVLIGPATESHAADISALILGLSHYIGSREVTSHAVSCP